MTPKLQNQLFKKYPKIFRQKDLSIRESCMAWGIDVGDGWYNLIDKLCGFLQYHIDENCIYQYSSIKIWISKWMAKPLYNFLYKCLKWSIHGNSSDHFIFKHTHKFIDWLNSPKWIKPPQIKAAQVKTKFGGLRWYFNWGENIRATSAVREFCENLSGAVSFAESLSYSICETCGREGQIMVKNGWFATLCPTCAKKEGYRKPKKIKKSP